MRRTHATDYVCMYVYVCIVCMQLVALDGGDERISRKIIEMIETENVAGVSYAKIARAAVMEGKPDLAIRLLDCEPKYSEQVGVCGG